MKKLGPIGLFILLVLATALAVQHFRSERYARVYTDVVSKYAKIRVGMTPDEVGGLFAGDEVPPPQKLDQSHNKANADSFQHIGVKIRIWPEFIAVYYKDGLVVGKQMIGYDPYPESDFPTVGE